VQRHLALYHGVIPLLLEFTDDAETTIDAAIAQLVARGYLSKTQVVALVQSGKRPIWHSASTHAIQVRVVRWFGFMLAGSHVNRST
jgi:pyruvate kinase